MPRKSIKWKSALICASQLLGGIQDKWAVRPLRGCVCRLLSSIRRAGKTVLCGLNCKIKHNRLKHEYSEVKETQAGLAVESRHRGGNLGSAHQAEMSASSLFIWTPLHSHSQCVGRPWRLSWTLQEFRVHGEALPMREMGEAVCLTLKHSTNVALPAFFPCS